MTFTHDQTGQVFAGIGYWMHPVKTNWGAAQWCPIGTATCDRGEAFTLHRRLASPHHRAINSAGLFRDLAPTRIATVPEHAEAAELRRSMARRLESVIGNNWSK